MPKPLEQHHYGPAEAAASCTSALADFARSAWAGAVNELKADVKAGQKLIPGNHTIKEAATFALPLEVIVAGATTRYAEHKAAEFRSDPKKAALEVMRDLAELASPVLPIVELRTNHHAVPRGIAAEIAGAAVVGGIAGAILHEGHLHHSKEALQKEATTHQIRH